MNEVKRLRGFAAMDPEKQRQIASMGGKAAQKTGSGHRFTSDEAQAAGRKGGQKIGANREFMSKIGRVGGAVTAARYSAKRDQWEQGE